MFESERKTFCHIYIFCKCLHVCMHACMHVKKGMYVNICYASVNVCNVCMSVCVILYIHLLRRNICNIASKSHLQKQWLTIPAGGCAAAMSKTTFKKNICFGCGSSVVTCFILRLAGWLRFPLAKHRHTQQI